MIVTIVVCVCLTLAFFNAVLFVRNILIYSPPPPPDTTKRPAVSVLIPARNEEKAIGSSVEAALASTNVELEVIVLDDHSDDRTAEIVELFRKRDSRVRLEQAPPLPLGWCGKQFACSVLSSMASHDILCFIDSDVRLSPQGVARMVRFMEGSGAELISGFPRQELHTFFEKLLLPMMHFLLLGFLPIDSMRKYLAPSLGAGCGQIFVARRAAYEKAGGHVAIRNSRHDGIALPKAFRKARLRTDLCDATDVATCRMYQNAAEVFKGLLKNANEGIAAPIRIFVFTALLAAGHILPLLLCAWLVLSGRGGLPLVLSVSALVLSSLPRLLAVRRFGQPWREALLHPAAVAVFLALQWYARYRDIVGTPAVWKGRTYQPT